MSAETELTVQIAQLQAQMKAMSDSLIKIEKGVDGISYLDKTIAEEMVKSTQLREQQVLMWKKFDDLSAAQKVYEGLLAKVEQAYAKLLEEKTNYVRDELCEETSSIRQTVVTIDKKVDQNLNFGKGILWTLCIGGSLIQSLIVFAIVWSFQTTSSNALKIHDLEIQLENVQKQIDKFHLKENAMLELS